MSRGQNLHWWRSDIYGLRNTIHLKMRKPNFLRFYQETFSCWIPAQSLISPMAIHVHYSTARNHFVNLKDYVNRIPKWVLLSGSVQVGSKKMGWGEDLSDLSGWKLAGRQFFGLMILENTWKGFSLSKFGHFVTEIAKRVKMSKIKNEFKVSKDSFLMISFIADYKLSI